MKHPRVLLADDHRIMAEGLKSLLTPEFDLVGVTEDGRDLIEVARKLRPDVIVSDITMPRLNGIEAIPQLKKDNPSVKVVLLTMHQDVAFVRRALDAGAAGFILKHSASSELVTAIRAVLDGKTYVTPTLAGELLQAMHHGADSAKNPVATLTPRQKEILQLIAEGSSAKEIAGTLKISSRTVEFHKYQMMESLRIESTAELIRFAVKEGIVSTNFERAR